MFNVFDRFFDVFDVFDAKLTRKYLEHRELTSYMQKMEYMLENNISTLGELEYDMDQTSKAVHKMLKKMISFNGRK